MKPFKNYVKLFFLKKNFSVPHDKQLFTPFILSRSKIIRRSFEIADVSDLSSIKDNTCQLIYGKDCVQGQDQDSLRNSFAQASRKLTDGGILRVILHDAYSFEKSFWEQIFQNSDMNLIEFSGKDNLEMTCLKVNSDGSTCNICGGKEFTTGPYGRMSETSILPQCSTCSSLERHRILRQAYNLINPAMLTDKKILQISEDMALGKNQYDIEISIYGSSNSIDIQHINRPDESYDVVVCNHVIEHVWDDRNALHELMRIVTKDGFLQLSTPNPLKRGTTDDWGFPDEKRHGHYREYGSDLVKRLSFNNYYFFPFVSTDSVTYVSEAGFLLSKSRKTINMLRTSLRDYIITL